MFTTLERHFLVGPDFVTIVDCGLSSYGTDNMVGNFDGEDARRRGGGWDAQGEDGTEEDADRDPRRRGGDQEVDDDKIW